MSTNSGQNRSQHTAAATSYSREEILTALTLAPCHITGTHDPTHTPKYICAAQLREGMQGLFDLLGITAADLPRRPHSYPPSSESGKLEAAWVERKPITFTVDTIPGKTWDDYGEAWNAAVDARGREGKFRVYGMTDGMKEPTMVGYW